MVPLAFLLVLNIGSKMITSVFSMMITFFWRARRSLLPLKRWIAPFEVAGLIPFQTLVKELCPSLVTLEDHDPMTRILIQTLCSVSAMHKASDVIR